MSVARYREDLHVLEDSLGYEFGDRGLLEQALTHKSCARARRVENNERLEFLGDAVLQLIVSQYLYRNYPELNEGTLAKVRALLVSQPTLARQARMLNVGGFLRVGKGEERTGARDRDSLLCDTLEAIFGAMYLDSDLGTVQPLVLNCLPEWDRSQLSVVDAKSTLQEHLQQVNQTTPTYNLAAEHGPDHDKQFVVEVCFGDEVLGRGRGRSKKEAAQSAARSALLALDVGGECGGDSD